MPLAVQPLRLGINVDHVATLRQARGTRYPDPVEAARLAAQGGAHSITIHLREDRRHIQDHDLARLLEADILPINLEMADTDEMVAIAVNARPKFVCLVPERRAERTTEGGLDVAGSVKRLAASCSVLAAAGIQVSLFIDPDPVQLKATLKVGAPHVEIHTGTFADAAAPGIRLAELAKIADFAQEAVAVGLEVHAGHGLNLDNVEAIAAIAQILELNIGHAIVARALVVGFRQAVAEMAAAMQSARGRAVKP